MIELNKRIKLLYYIYIKNKNIVYSFKKMNLYIEIMEENKKEDPYPMKVIIIGDGKVINNINKRQKKNLGR